MNEILKDYIGKIRIGGHQAFRNLAMFPITSDEVIPFDYLTLDEALSKDLIEVVEIDEEGSVPELRVVNRSDKMVLILDGEELIGAKQNRIVNTTILIPGCETVVIPVSCVEQGRWGYASERFQSEKRLAPFRLRVLKATSVHCSMKASSRALVSEFIDLAAASRVEPYPAVGAGTDLRLDSKKCTGFALSHKVGVLHLSVFARDDGGKGRRLPGRR